MKITETKENVSNYSYHIALSSTLKQNVLTSDSYMKISLDVDLCRLVTNVRDVRVLSYLIPCLSWQTLKASFVFVFVFKSNGKQFVHKYMLYTVGIIFVPAESLSGNKNYKIFD